MSNIGAARPSPARLPAPHGPLSPAQPNGAGHRRALAAVRGPYAALLASSRFRNQAAAVRVQQLA